MGSILIVLSIFGADVFFSLSAIIGYNYLGIESSPTYLVYIILIFALSYFSFIKNMVLTKKKYSTKYMFPLLIPIILTINFFLTTIRGKSSDLAIRYYFLFLVFVTPAIITGVYTTFNRKLKPLDKYSNILMLIFGFSVFVSAFSSLSEGTSFTSLGGATYQTASYLGGFSYGLNLYSIFEQDNSVKFSYQKTNIYRIFSFILLPLQIIAILITGGRGGMVLVLLYSLYFLYELFHSGKIEVLVKYTILIGLLLLLLFSIIPSLLTIDSFNSSFQRTFSYISSTGIDFSQTSNRDLAYGESLRLIRQSPVIGFGYFGMWKITGYPHNIFLEILQQGGIIYLTIFMIVSLMLLVKIKKMIKFDNSNKLIIVVALYPITMLLFSGTYQINSIFWFVVSYVISYKIETPDKSL
ncbi:O-antigen ligase family protein [Jeotgalibaca sp. A127]|uniref:O-antigen ligase family protein n=1 Tax=Jeotgalibaca sp. A127 TaxID=3457324 RepID=UPI003FD4FF41